MKKTGRERPIHKLRWTIFITPKAVERKREAETTDYQATAQQLTTDERNWGCLWFPTMERKKNLLFLVKKIVRFGNSICHLLAEWSSGRRLMMLYTTYGETPV
jgi:hypothetical protein